MKDNYLYLAVGVLGLLMGVSASAMMQQDSSYCSSIEEDIRQNRSFNGSVACYPPGVLDANVSDRVEENTELRCVCRIIDRTGIRLFPIAVSN
jgi:hypothetical protein